ncbi:hypothetical protein K1719_036504 [Acacia pycnantha]|nr:hypothetical protein K1719_036504 [Acacia pycnantha]
MHGQSPCCEKEHTNKAAWTKKEDQCLINYINLHGEGCRRPLPKAAVLRAKKVRHVSAIAREVRTRGKEVEDKK